MADFCYWNGNTSSFDDGTGTGFRITQVDISLVANGFETCQFYVGLLEATFELFEAIDLAAMAFDIFRRLEELLPRIQDAINRIKNRNEGVQGILIGIRREIQRLLEQIDNDTLRELFGAVIDQIKDALIDLNKLFTQFINGVCRFFTAAAAKPILDQIQYSRFCALDPDIWELFIARTRHPLGLPDLFLVPDDQAYPEYVGARLMIYQLIYNEVCTCADLEGTLNIQATLTNTEPLSTGCAFTDVPVSILRCNIPAPTVTILRLITRGSIESTMVLQGNECSPPVDTERHLFFCVEETPGTSTPGGGTGGTSTTMTATTPTMTPSSNPCYFNRVFEEFAESFYLGTLIARRDGKWIARFSRGLDLTAAVNDFISDPRVVSFELQDGVNSTTTREFVTPFGCLCTTVTQEFVVTYTVFIPEDLLPAFAANPRLDRLIEDIYAVFYSFDVRRRITIQCAPPPSPSLPPSSSPTTTTVTNTTTTATPTPTQTPSPTGSPTPSIPAATPSTPTPTPSIPAPTPSTPTPTSTPNPTPSSPACELARQRVLSDYARFPGYYTSYGTPEQAFNDNTQGSYVGFYGEDYIQGVIDDMGSCEVSIVFNFFLEQYLIELEE